MKLGGAGAGAEGQAAPPTTIARLPFSPDRVSLIDRGSRSPVRSRMTVFAPARAAVSLTYDDGMHEHLDHAMPDLEAVGLRGTFYAHTRPDGGSGFTARPLEWAAAAARRGHELGNHTRHHACRRAGAGRSLFDYTLPQIEQELRGAAADLDAVVGPAVRSFAYACCDTDVGPADAPVSYVDVCDRLFPAARVGGDALADPSTVDLRRVPSLVVREGVPVDRVVAFVDEAIERGHWAVLMFHGVGGGWLNVERRDHQAICAAVAGRANRLWCDTFVNVALRVRAATNRPWRGE